MRSAIRLHPDGFRKGGKVVSVKCRIGMNRQRIVIEEFARMHFEENYKHCRSCEGQECMTDCRRNLYIPEEMEKIHRLIISYGSN